MAIYAQREPHRFYWLYMPPPFSLFLAKGRIILRPAIYYRKAARRPFGFQTEKRPKGFQTVMCPRGGGQYIAALWAYIAVQGRSAPQRAAIYTQRAEGPHLCLKAGPLRAHNCLPEGAKGNICPKGPRCKGPSGRSAFSYPQRGPKLSDIKVKGESC